MDTDFIPICSSEAVANPANESKSSKSRTEKSEPKRISLLTDIAAPWLQYETVDVRRVPPMVRLHNEILSFCRYIAPSKAEILRRKQLFDEIAVVAHSLWPSCSGTDTI